HPPEPLHCGFASDRGGNTIDVHWYRRKTVLHHVWDVSIIQTAEKDYYDEGAGEFVDALNKNITGGVVRQSAGMGGVRQEPDGVPRQIRVGEHHRGMRLGVQGRDRRFNAE
uniref:Aspergillus nuclease S1 n=1 Tax=Aegilops tauschii subsp. strangulata TaxID=200361 RepID=A0A453DT30_AEGTS